MATVPMIEYAEASPEVRAVYDDIMAVRKTDWINNFWKVLANHPPTLRRTWESIKEVMAPGALDPLTKELVYIAVSASNACEYCVRSHSFAARAKGMSEAMMGELMAVVGMANETNAFANFYQVDVDDRFMVTGAPAKPARRGASPAARGGPGRGPRGRPARRCRG